MHHSINEAKGNKIMNDKNFYATSNNYIKRCARCGRVLENWQRVNGYLVCADDRNCYPKNPNRAMRALQRNKLKYGDDM